MSFSFVRRYVQRHGRTDTFTALLSTKSHTTASPSASPVKKGLRLDELGGLIPPKPSFSPDSLTAQIHQLKIGETILGQNSLDLLRRDPSPVHLAPKLFHEVLRSTWLVDRLDEIGVVAPTNIQRLLSEKMIGREDLLIKAQTGTGKSFGYLVALLDRLRSDRVVEHQDIWESLNLVIVPNSIIANQLVNWTQKLLKKSSVESAIRVILSEGDQIAYEPSMEPGFAHIIVATPKGLLTRLAQGKFAPSRLTNIVLDEADFLLKPLSKYASQKEKMNRQKHPLPTMTALEQIRDHFLTKRKDGPRMVALSASLGWRTRNLLKAAGLIQKDALFLEDHEEKGECPSTISHYHRLLNSPQDMEELAGLVNSIVAEQSSGSLGIVFTKADNSKTYLKSFLDSFGISSLLLSDATTRDIGDSHLLIGSDVDARGLDHPRLSYVIQTEAPESAISYMHVAGRVGRMGRSGSVYTILRANDELERFIGYLGRLGLPSSPFIPKT